MPLFDSPTPKPENIRAQGVAILTPLVADALTLFLAARFCHWNLRGPVFLPFHKLFEETYQFFDSTADVLAERIATLGGRAPGTLEQVSSLRTAVAFPSASVDPTSLVDAFFSILLKPYAEAISNACEKTQELGLWADNNVLMTVLQDLEKLGWFQIAHLQSGGTPAHPHA